ncbi:MAG: hypothetical protein A3G33_03060 [Omnitrophica bacterium RIFCSPLOWO2_12_FULL_44_17]|uniref:6-carboxy-5,6,7,8-tetrahydropterin synthase n=1 Tax=Candidatus Danuiimicrobium aquiferis TaxID=1801832 RepID=A0A1G1KQX6_9BACT|nr:MAG: hypothetical protein A3B72_01815 [Omnitrophica bacterium RIFCSPHIGHO2_02_FULL_45_28]OGW95316.1 MAG: hypothetical protein A3G33_03060 [Omnitrophica bacterium RIFCSPLOWO2_12_FULL_44_17]OGX04719.1 MAG: hypothetical protein A3J12_09090 [Omnitrophica bacterium RIFCSPLOWO2_02_FULL_44_11]
MSYSVTKTIHFSYGHRLSDYEGECRNFHGHNGKAEIELSSDSLNQFGMVRDFREVNQVMKAWIDQTLDHKLILWKNDPLAALLKQQKEPFYEMETRPTAEAIAKLIYDVAISKGFPATRVTLWETETSSATYHG